jgi:hypothetical protein
MTIDLIQHENEIDSIHQNKIDPVTQSRIEIDASEWIANESMIRNGHWNLKI